MSKERIRLRCFEFQSDISLDDTHVRGIRRERLMLVKQERKEEEWKKEEAKEEVEREVEEDGDEERRRGRWLVAESISRAELNLRHRGSFGDATNFPNGGFPLGRARIQGIPGVLHGNPTNSPTADNQETDLPCVAYIFTLFYFFFFFSSFISFYPSFPPWKLPIRFSSYLPLYPLLFLSFFRFVSFSSIRRGGRGGGRGETIPLLFNIVDLTFQAQNSFSYACYTNLCLYMRDSMRVYIGMRESTLILPTTDTTPSARLIRTWRL